MPSFWDYIRFNRQYSNSKRNLEEGLFQIASQTCNILVKVNNTNNINLTPNNRSDEYGCAGPPSSSNNSMQVCVPKFRKNSITSGCNSKLSVSIHESYLQQLSKKCIARLAQSMCSVGTMALWYYKRSITYSANLLVNPIIHIGNCRYICCKLFFMSVTYPPEQFCQKLYKSVVSNQGKQCF